MDNKTKERIEKHLEHKLGDIFIDLDGEIILSKTGKKYIYADGYITKRGKTSCSGCCFGPHARCKNEYDLCVKHHGPKYRSWIYKESK